MTGAPTMGEAYVNLARDLLDGSVRLRRVAPARAACWVARRGLESVVLDLLRARGVDTGSGTMRSQLICLAVAYDHRPDLVTDVTSLWDQLSRACHHHGYELTPTIGEARDLISRLCAIQP